MNFLNWYRLKIVCFLPVFSGVFSTMFIILFEFFDSSFLRLILDSLVFNVIFILSFITMSIIEYKLKMIEKSQPRKPEKLSELYDLPVEFTKQDIKPAILSLGPALSVLLLYYFLIRMYIPILALIGALILAIRSIVKDD